MNNTVEQLKSENPIPNPNPNGNPMVMV